MKSMLVLLCLGFSSVVLADNVITPDTHSGLFRSVNQKNGNAVILLQKGMEYKAHGFDQAVKDCQAMTVAVSDRLDQIAFDLEIPSRELAFQISATYSDESSLHRKIIACQVAIESVTKDFNFAVGKTEKFHRTAPFNSVVSELDPQSAKHADQLIASDPMMLNFFRAEYIGIFGVSDHLRLQYVKIVKK